VTQRQNRRDRGERGGTEREARERLATRRSRFDVAQLAGRGRVVEQSGFTQLGEREQHDLVVRGEIGVCSDPHGHLRTRRGAVARVEDDRDRRIQDVSDVLSVVMHDHRAVIGAGNS